jgi:hypothetical protein
MGIKKLKNCKSFIGKTKGNFVNKEKNQKKRSSSKKKQRKMKILYEIC